LSKLISCNQFQVGTVAQELPLTSRYCRWWGILYSSARNCYLAFW